MTPTVFRKGPFRFCFWSLRELRGFEGGPCRSSGGGNRAQQGLRTAVSCERMEARRAGVSVRRVGMGNPEPARGAFLRPESFRSLRDARMQRRIQA